MSGTILIVDPDSHITSLLAGSIQAEGYEAEAVETASEALSRNLSNYMMVISETITGDIDGFEFLERLRDITSCRTMPFIFCTESDREKDIIHGLEMGADDYVVKPFSLREFLARIKSVLRRHHATLSIHQNQELPKVPVPLVYQGLRLIPERGQATADGQPVQLSPTEFQILLLLFSNRNKLYTREEIFETVWPGAVDSSPRTVDVNISRLRKKLGSRGHHLVSRTGLGYGYME